MKRYLLLALAAATIMSGCAEDSSRPKATGEGTVRALNAISTSPTVTFQIEERFVESLPFKSAPTTTTWDDLDYTFNFEVVLTGDFERTRVASVFIDVEKDRDYTMLLSGDLEAPDVTVWEADIRQWADSDTAFELRVAHSSPALGPVDVYYEPLGTAPVLGNELGTIAFGEILPAREFEPGERSLFLTAVGDPSNVLYESRTLALASRTSYILSPFDADASDVGSVSVLLINTTTGGGGPVSDVNVGSTVRFFHASRDMGNTDIYIDDPLTTPLVSNQAFGEYTDDIPLPSGEYPLTYTAPGNMGSILIDADRALSSGAHHSIFAIRDSNDEDGVLNFVIDRRSIETQAKLSLINTSIDNPTVDVYLVQDDVTVEDTFPLIPLLGTLEPPSSVQLLPDEYDIYLTVPFEKTILLGPIPLDAQAGDVNEAIIYDTTDPNVPLLEFIPLP